MKSRGTAEFWELYHDLPPEIQAATPARFLEKLLFVYDLDLFIEYLPRKPVDRHMHPVTLLTFDDEVVRALGHRYLDIFRA